MGIFDFLKSKDVPVSGQVGPGGLLQPPTLEHQPGLWERYKTPNDQGISMADRVLMGLMSLNGDTQGALQYGAGLKKTTKDNADRARKNAAIKAAYDPATGKFDIAKYNAAVGDQGDATEGLALAKELAPKTGVDGSFSYSIDPISGQVHWGEQRAPSHSEVIQATREAASEDHQRVMESYYAALAKAALQNAGSNEYRAHKPPASAGRPAATGVPQGYHIVGGPR